MRGRSYSYSPSPPRRYRSPSLRRHYGRGKDLPTSLLVRNLRLDCRPEDLRVPFGRFGPIRDIYLPRDYYTGEPRGFGFVEYLDPVDAEDAKYEMDGYMLHGRELTVVFAEKTRKKPSEMRARERLRSRSYDRRRSSSRYSRSPHYRRSYSRGSDDYSPRRRYSRSVSPGDRSYGRRSYRSRSYSRSPYQSPYGSRSQSRSPYRSPSRSASPGYSR